MRAVYFEEFNTPPTVSELPDPEPSPAGIVLAVEATGLCRSDWHAWTGHDDDVHLPHVPGHEMVGRITAVGPEVTLHEVGDRVTVPFVCACGKCPECLSGNGQVCRDQRQPGFTDWGSYAELVALHNADVNLIPVPEDMDAGAAASLGCRFATSYRGLAHVGKVQPGEWVVVVGCGGVGLSAVMIAHALGARVIGVDISDDALGMARRFGAEHTVNPSSPDFATDDDVAAAIREATDGGAHVSVEALGRENTAAIAIRSLRRRGRHVQIGLFATAPHIPMGDVIGHELSIFGSHGMPAHDYPELLALVASGKLRPQDLITRRISLDEAPAALAAMSGATAAGGMTLILP